MKYKKRESPSYNPRIVQLSLGSYTVSVNYSEITDESCLEFSHVHGDFEIYYCLQGTMHLQVEKDRIEMGEGEVTILPPGLFHNTMYEPKKAKRYFIFVFETTVKTGQKARIDGNERMDLYLKQVIERIGQGKAITFTDRYNSSSIIEQLGEEMLRDYPDREEMISTFYSQYLLRIFRNLEISLGESDKRENKDGAAVNLALELTQYMHDNYNKNIGVKDAADHFHISERHVGRIFDKYFGTSFKHTLNIYRINYAKNYLLDTELSIEKIAELVGISSTRKFNQLFREIEDISVADYREKHKGKCSHYKKG